MKAKTLPNRRGQSLVEMALVLPSFFVGVLAIVQIMTFCRNQLEMQRVAQVAAKSVGSNAFGTSSVYTQFNRLWGRRTPVISAREEPVTLDTWQPYHGVSTLRRHASLRPVSVGMVLLPRGSYSGESGSAQQIATDWALIEDPVPGEDE